MMDVQMESPRVLLVDDLPEMLETVTQLLRDDFEIVGYAQDGEEAPFFPSLHTTPSLLDGCIRHEGKTLHPIYHVVNRRAVAPGRGF